MLTPRQLELLTYIDRRIREDGIAPTFGEMTIAVKLKSKHGIYRLLSGLEQRGFIRRLPKLGRAIEVLKTPPRPASETKDLREIALSKCPPDYGFVGREAFVAGFLAAGYFFVFEKAERPAA